MRYTRLFIFGLGVAVGVGAVYAVKSKTSKKRAVALASKGLELKDRLACMADNVKESVEDIMAEARYVNEQGDVEEPCAK